MPSREFEDFYQTIMAKVAKGEVSLAETRAGFEKMMEGFSAAPDIEFKNLSLKKLPAAWVHAPNATNKNVILFFHAGGYSAGSVRSHQDLIGRLSRSSGMDVLAIDYRLAPEHPYPAAMEDAEIAYNFLLKDYKPGQIILAGASAGGGMVLSLMLMLKETKKKMPRAGICICPWVDLALKGKSLTSNAGKDILTKARLQKAADYYLHGHTPEDSFVSPLYGDLSQLPPLIIHAGSRELLLDEIQRLAQKAQNSGVETHFEIFEGMFHSWHLFAAKIPEGAEAIEKIGKIIAKLIL